MAKPAEQPAAAEAAAPAGESSAPAAAEVPSAEQSGQSPPADSGEDTAPTADEGSNQLGEDDDLTGREIEVYEELDEEW